MVSVNEVMWSEFKRKNEGFGYWFKIEKQKLNEAGFVEIKHLRNTIVHSAGNLEDKLERDHYLPATTGGLSLESSVSKWLLQFNGKSEDLFVTCSRYIDLLSKMVEYCDNNFKWYDLAEDADSDGRDDN